MKKLLILLLVLAFNPAAADQHELTAETFTEEFVLVRGRWIEGQYEQKN